MAKVLAASGPILRGVQAVLVAVAVEHVAGLRRILATPEVRQRWRAEDAAAGWPFDDSSVTRFAVLLGRPVVGMVQYGEESRTRTTGTPRSTSSSIPQSMVTVSDAMPSPPWRAT